MRQCSLRDGRCGQGRCRGHRWEAQIGGYLANLPLSVVILSVSTVKPSHSARLGGDAGSCCEVLWLRSGWPGLWYLGSEPGWSRGRVF